MSDNMLAILDRMKTVAEERGLDIKEYLPNYLRFRDMVATESTDYSIVVALFDNLVPRMGQILSLARYNAPERAGDLIPKIVALETAIQGGVEQLPLFSELVEKFTYTNWADRLSTAMNRVVELTYNPTAEATIPREWRIDSMAIQNLDYRTFATAWVGHLYSQMLFVWLNKFPLVRRNWGKDDWLHAADDTLKYERVIIGVPNELTPSFERLSWVKMDHYRKFAEVAEELDIAMKWNPL